MLITRFLAKLATLFLRWYYEKGLICPVCYECDWTIYWDQKDHNDGTYSFCCDSCGFKGRFYPAEDENEGTEESTTPTIPESHESEPI